MDDESRKRMDDVYSKWEGNAPSAAALEERRQANSRSQAWSNAFSGHEVSTSRVERKMRQTKPQKHRGGGGGGGGGQITLAALPPYTPKFAFDTGFGTTESLHRVNHVFSGESCASCTSISKSKFLERQLNLQSGFKNILTVRPPATAPTLSHTLPYAYSVFSKDVVGSHPSVYKDVLASSRVKTCIEEVIRDEVEARQDKSAEPSIRRSVLGRVNQIARGLYSCVRALGLRLNAWALYHIFSHLMTSLEVRYEEVKMLRTAYQEQIPIVIIPTHRSHLDSLVMLFTMFITEQQIPRTVAGDNLNLPLVSGMFRNHGAFFIRRRLDQGDRKDKLYRGVLQEHIEQLLKHNQTLMFYIEGSRSRSGRVGAPKGGLMSCIVDAVVAGVVSDVYVVPAAITYDRMLESESYGKELMGLPKEKETFWNAIWGLWGMLTGRVGQVRVNFAQPFSVNEFIRKQTFTVDADAADDAAANSVGDVRQLVQSVGAHVRHTMERISPVMSTHIVSCLLLTRYRHGAPLSQLQQAYEWLEASLIDRRRDVGFADTPERAVSHACAMLSDAVELAAPEIDGAECDAAELWATPRLTVPHVYQLSICAAQVLPSFLCESVIACSLHAMVYSNQRFIQNSVCELDIVQLELLTVAEEVCHLLRKEFTFALPCQPASTNLGGAIERMQTQCILTTPANTYSRRYHAETDVWDEQEHGEVVKLKLKLEPVSRAWLQFLQMLLRPVLETYWVTARQLCVLLDTGMEESLFINAVLEHAQERFEKGLTRYPETAVIEPIKNAVKSLLENGILTLEPSEDPSTSPPAPLLYLSAEHCSQGAIDDLASKINDLMA